MEPNQKQQEVIKSIKNNRITLVEAPPGTGKTYTAVCAAIEFVAGQIEDNKNYNKKVLILTFSKNARAQINKQFEKLANGKSKYENNIEISNYHSFYQKYIWAYSRYLDMPSDLTITAPSKRRTLISNFLKGKGLLNPTKAQIGWAIDLLEGDFRPTPKQAAKYKEVQAIVNLKDDIINYIMFLNKSGEIGFSDFGHYMKVLIKKSKSLLLILRSKYKFIILDEYQDSSDTQDYIVKEIIGLNNKALYFADCKQMIYAWRGAKETRLNELKEFYGNEINILELLEIHRYKNKNDLIKLIDVIRKGSYNRIGFQQAPNIKYIDIRVDAKVINLFDIRIKNDCYFKMKYKILNELKLHRGKNVGILCWTNDIVNYMREKFKVEFNIDLKELNNNEKEHDLLFFIYEFLGDIGCKHVDELIKFVFELTFKISYEKEFGKVKKNKLDDITLKYILKVRNDVVKKVTECFSSIISEDDFKRQLIIYLKFISQKNLTINNELMYLVLKLIKMKDMNSEKVNSLLLQHQYISSYKELKGDYILNVHQSKGREFDVVFVINSDSIEKDTNLFYVAVSRVKEKLVLFNWKTS